MGSGKSAEIKDSNYQDESQVQLNACNGQANQMWKVQGKAIVNPVSGKCLDINNHDGLTPDKYKDQTKVELFSCNGNPNQEWEFENGQLVNPPSGKCLDIYSPHGDLKDGTKLQLFACGAGKPNQGWKLRDAVTVV